MLTKLNTTVLQLKTVFKENVYRIYKSLREINYSRL